MNFGFVNCSENIKFCKSNGPKNLPGLILFPPTPIPATEYSLDAKTAVNQAVKYVKNYA